jgi:lipoyl-dependent peroxiredoxin
MGSVQITGPERDDVADFCIEALLLKHNDCLKIDNVINSNGAEPHTAVAGRPGRALADRAVDSMGGPRKPGTATPEHLFAAGYAACFGGALDFVGKQHKQDAAKAKITCAVSIGPREGGGFGIAVKLRVEDKSLKQADLAALTQEAHEKICPYSHATRGNVAVQLEIIVG